MAVCDQFSKTGDEPADILGMQAGGWFVTDDQARTAIGCHESCGKLQPLRFAARKRFRRLTKDQVVEPDLLQHLETILQSRLTAEETRRLRDTHGQHIGDRTTPIFHFENLVPITSSTTLGTTERDIGQKLHVVFQQTGAQATATTSALGGIETELLRGEATLFRIGRRGERLTNLVKHVQPSGRIASR